MRLVVWDTPEHTLILQKGWWQSAWRAKTRFSGLGMTAPRERTVMLPKKLSSAVSADLSSDGELSEVTQAALSDLLQLSALGVTEARED